MVFLDGMSDAIYCHANSHKANSCTPSSRGFLHGSDDIFAKFTCTKSADLHWTFFRMAIFYNLRPTKLYSTTVFYIY